MTIAAGTYWFPGNLGYHITRWNVGAASEARFSCVALEAPVREPSDATPVVIVRPVFDVDLSVMLSGSWGYFASGASLTGSGFYVTDWEPVNEDAALIGEVWVGIVVEVSEEIDERDLVLGLAEVQIR